MVTRRRVRVAAGAGGALLLLGLMVAPSLTGLAVVAASAAWLTILALLLYYAGHVLVATLGRIAGVGVLVLGIVAPLVLTGVDWSGSAGTYLPCRRNWGWLPSYLLRSSPLRRLDFTVGETRVRLCYGEPRARGRTMIGGAQVPFGRLWRTGANEPTTIRADGPLVVAGVPVRGNASLYTIPGPESWEIVLNPSTSQWGIESEYTDEIRARELGRSIVPSRRSESHAERLKFEAEPVGSDSVRLVLTWEWTEVHIPVWHDK